MSRPRYRKVVVKIGSTLITDGGRGLDRKLIAACAEQMAALRTQEMLTGLVLSGGLFKGNGPLKGLFGN